MPTATYAMPRVEHSRPSTSKNMRSSDWHRDATTSKGIVLMLPMEDATTTVRRRRGGARRDDARPRSAPSAMEKTRLTARGHHSRKMEASTASATWRAGGGEGWGGVGGRAARAAAPLSLVPRAFFFFYFSPPPRLALTNVMAGSSR